MKLVRYLCTPEGTLGYIDLPLNNPSPDVDGVRIYTLERPWVPLPRQDIKIRGTIHTSELASRATATWNTVPPCGRKGVSCIPPGKYQLVPHSSEVHPRTYALVNPDLWVYHFEETVPAFQKGIARTAVLIHPANHPEELRGCIAPGLVPGKPGPSVFNSREAFKILMPYLEDELTLEIVDEVSQ